MLWRVLLLAIQVIITAGQKRRWYSNDFNLNNLYNHNLNVNSVLNEYLNVNDVVNRNLNQQYLNNNNYLSQNLYGLDNRIGNRLYNNEQSLTGGRICGQKWCGGRNGLPNNLNYKNAQNYNNEPRSKTQPPRGLGDWGQLKMMFV
nr:clustered-asparagine-rich protein-like [Plodia interpunctella]